MEQSGKIYVYLVQFFTKTEMASLIGEFECKLDIKSRVMLPANLKKQFAAEDQFSFVINRGFEKCLVLYPLSEWKKISEELRGKLSLYTRKNREFVRYFFRGATELSVDTNNRILLPKNLLEYAGIDREIVLFAFFNRVEIWAKELYGNILTDEPEDFSDLAEEVMGKNTIEGHEQKS